MSTHAHTLYVRGAICARTRARAGYNILLYIRCIYRLHTGELYIIIMLNSIFFFFTPSGETGTRQMLSDPTRGSRGRFFGVCAV